MLSVLTRVGGVGDGLFVIFFFLALSVLICAMGMRTDRPSVFCTIAVLLSLFIILFMVFVPKAPPGGSSSSDEDGRPYDDTAGLRKAAAGLLGVFALCTFGCVCHQVIMAPIQGTRIRSAV